ncbi:MAG TPA: ATP-dependent DNA helicase RecG [Candidatus Saccharimonadales bacterium]|jgi:ATP-dependent DNA helicase RecG|nr:ATP-dependent DNA helicase RecG [Candidatus Saccharimonadales bacterium]
MTLQDPIQTVKGVGEQTAQKLSRLGIETIHDLIYFLPRRYEDFASVRSISQIEPGPITVRAKVDSLVTRRVRRGLHITEAVLVDSSGKIRAVWFNQPYRADQLRTKEAFLFTGTYDFQRNRYVLQNPSAEKVSELDEEGQGGKIVPIYPETKGLKSHTIRALVATILPLMHAMPETLPPEITKHQKLLPLSAALVSLHSPSTSQELEAARERLAFEELFELLLASLLNKYANAALESWQIPFNETAAKEFVATLSFTLTNAQRKAAWEVVKNFETGQPMNRLLQGDVGSGKTVVAALAAYLAAKQGYQTALMAPTEILATQHATTLLELLSPLGINVALLIGATKPKAKQEIYRRLQSGDIDIVVGTHALIQKDTHFARLGFVIIDEQHRFGVRQRAELLTKSQRMPHLLAMSATPIPRSLALTVYGELDISILDELPKGRKQIETHIISPNSRTQLYAKIDAQIADGRQAYVLCPLVADSDLVEELKSVETEYKRLKSSIFKHRRLGILHGQLKNDDKEAIMKSFAAGDIDILVCTTVVEVGVDVPNATVMLIEGADRFGLAQLHQLRGRVGRGAHQSYCYLVPSTSQKPSGRLREMEHSTDGFYLAEKDLELRGPGEIYGRVQHGSLDLRIASLADTKLIKRARAEADWCIEHKLNLLQYPQLQSQVEKYRRLTSLQ